MSQDIRLLSATYLRFSNIFVFILLYSSSDTAPILFSASNSFSLSIINAGFSSDLIGLSSIFTNSGTRRYCPPDAASIPQPMRPREFTSRDFAEDDERPGCYLKKGSRKRFYPLYENWAGTMRPLWVEEVRNLTRRIMDGKDPLSE